MNPLLSFNWDLEGPDNRPVKLTIFYLALFVLVFPLLASQIRSNDTWKALYSGRYLWWFWKFPHHSTFTFSPVRDFIARDAYTWLSNLFLYQLYLLGDYWLLQLLRACILLGTLVLLHSMVEFKPSVSLLALFVLFSYGIDQKLHLRSSIFAVPFTVLTIWLWHRVKYSGRSSLLWWYPPVMVLWGNLHASYLVGVGLLIVMASGEFLEQYRVKKADWQFVMKLWLVVVLTVPAVLLVKPFPDPLLLDQFRSLSSALAGLLSLDTFYESFLAIVTGGFISPGVGASREFFIGRGGYRFALDSLHLPLVQYSILIALLGCLTLRRQWRKWGGAMIALMAVILPFGLRFTRTVAYLPLVVTPLILMVIARSIAGKIRLTARKTTVAAALFLVVFAGFYGYQGFFGKMSRLSGNPRLRVGVGKIPLFSDHVPDYLRKHYPNKRFLNPWGEGTYLIWKWWPVKKVYIDSKAVPYKTKFLQSYDSEWAIRWGFDYVVLWKYRSKVKFYLKSDLWRIIVQDRSMIAFSRKVFSTKSRPVEPQRVLPLP